MGMEDHPPDDAPRHPPGRPPHLSIARLLAVAALAATAAGPARAAAPVARSCVADTAAGRCTAVPQGSLRGASALAVSPDGRRVYVAAYAAGQLLSLGRSASGVITFAGCVTDDGRAGCANAPSYALRGTSGVATGPDGAVYVASGLGRSISRLQAAPSGPPAFGACTADLGAAGCLDPDRDTLAGASAVAVGPGGADVYVTSFDGAAVSHFERGPAGELVLADCLADAGGFGCTSTPGNVLEGAAGIAVAPGGRDVYVASFASGAIVRLHRAAEGALSFADCIADRGANGCARVPVDSLVGATGLAVKPDGRRLYVAAQTGTVAAFARNPARGTLRFVGCVGRDGPRGCARLRANTLAGATGLALRGRRLFIAAQRSAAITELRAGRGGRLGFSSCVTARRVRGCRRGPARSLVGVYALAARGRDLFAASPARATVTAFRLSAGR
jgi:6-phosphogluconolactonase (cycloisomerase 2 family)